MTELPAPATTFGLGHLGRWTFAPVRLLEDGARRGEVFRLRLWRPVIVGYRPAWNRAILGDLDTFRSAGSLSDLTPYLASGVVHADVPGHDTRRRELNPTFHTRALAPLAGRLRRVADAARPHEPFEALGWAATTVRHMLNAAFFAGTFPEPLLADFLAPLDRDPPAPFLPRPRLFARTDAAINRILRDPPPATLAASLAPLPGAVNEIRVALAAGYDTTAHTLAWALWHLAAAPDWRSGDRLPQFLQEVLRLYPTGWIGSRVARRDATVSGIEVRAGTMVLYSPYLTHRDPASWPDPASFRPERFTAGIPAWSYLPFSAGRRTCLGARLAQMMLIAALESFADELLIRIHGDPAVRTTITLKPAGPLWMSATRRTRSLLGTAITGNDGPADGNTVS